MRAARPATTRAGVDAGAVRDTLTFRGFGTSVKQHHVGTVPFRFSEGLDIRMPVAGTSVNPCLITRVEQGRLSAVTAESVIHPVAARRPGSDGRAVCRAERTCDQVFEMEAINGEFVLGDVAIVPGAKQCG
jgi:hypothetical protein